MRQESHSSSSSSTSPSSPTFSEIQTREREDRIESDISPVQVSNSVDDRSGQPGETTIERGNSLNSKIPEWLQEFRENLVDDEIPLQGGSHASSSHEVSLEPTTKRREDFGKHNVHTHFPKDRNCEICLPWNHCTSTPHRSETNGIAGKAVRRVKECTSAVLLQSGLNESWWADSMECYTYLRNVTDLLSDGKTPYERRFGQPFNGPIIPFGSLVEYHPKTAKDQSRIHKFGKKILPGLFLGYALYAGRIWKGDVLIADLVEFETMDASEIYSKRLSAKEVIFPQEKEEFIFPIGCQARETHQ